jgi:hypothetical protein
MKNLQWPILRYHTTSYLQTVSTYHSTSGREVVSGQLFKITNTIGKERDNDNSSW